MKGGIIRPPRGRPSKVTKASAPRRLSRGIGADQLAQEFQEGVDHDPALAEDGAEGGEGHQHQQHDITGDIDEAEADAEMDEDAQAQAAAAHAHQQQHMDMTAANILANGGIATAAASMYGDDPHTHGLPSGLGAGPSGVGLHGAPMPPAQMGPGGALDYVQQQQQQQASMKSTEEMAVDSGYTNFKIDSAFAKRLARDPGQRLAEQRKPDQELNLVRRSNVEALFAQIAGSLAPQPCNHCRKGQGPWTACVLYAGQMMGSCANCWFNASGSRCSFHGMTFLSYLIGPRSPT